MFSKIRNAVLALAAVAAIGGATLVTATTSADARGFSGGSFRGGSVGIRHVGGHGPRIGGGIHIGHRTGIHRPGINIKIGHHRPHFRPHFRPRPHWCHRWYHHCRIHVRWPRPVIYGAAPVVATTYAVAPAVAAAPRPCTCLTKEYTPDNLVVFKDVCTKEVASAPIGNTQTQLQLPAQPQEQAPPQK